MSLNIKTVVVNGKEFDAEALSKPTIIEQKGNDFRVLYKEKLYDIKVLKKDENSGKQTLKVNGFTMEVEPKTELDMLINQLGFNQAKKVLLKEILAPMPGLVLDILVEEGQEINTGDNLFKLEAMKMENIIKAGGSGVITEICVKKGEKVEKGSVLAKL